MSLPQGKEKFECVYSYMMLKLIQIMVLRTRISLFDLLYPYKISLKIPKLKSFNIKTNYRCYTNYIWEFVASVK